MIHETAKSEMALNRKCLIKIIECLQFLGRQGIAIQGSTDKESLFNFCVYVVKTAKILQNGWKEKLIDTPVMTYRKKF